MPDWRQLAGLINFSIAYYTTQLVRCAAFSFVLIGFVMLLRKVLFSERTFLRGMSWALFLVIPFLGKLKMFYENEAVLKATWRITAVTASWLWVDRIYLAGILVAAICIFGKRMRLQRTVAGMEKVMFESIHVYVTDMNITPFTIGLLKPKIVLPKVMTDSYNVEELKAIVQHEQTHIRLGHLWFGFVWDILKCLLWINPFLTVFQKHFWEDMEDICDRVCIQSSGSTAHEYGLILLKTLKTLRPESETAPSAVTYAGEQEFADMKRRMEKIAGFRPYRKWLCRSMVAVAFLMIAAMLLVVHTHSYARCNESKDIMVGNYDGNPQIISYDTEKLSQMISYDDRCAPYAEWLGQKENPQGKGWAMGEKYGEKILSILKAIMEEEQVQFMESLILSAPYMVRVVIPDLNIRRGPGTGYAKTGKFTGVGVFTIVEESDGWGLLKAYQEKRDGWISLAFTTRI